MSDSLIKSGARIQASSNDERFPPKSIIDGSKFETGATSMHFLTELERRENDLNVEELVSAEFTATHLRFTIRAAYDHFCSVHKVTVGELKSASGTGASTEENNLLSVGLDTAPKLSPRHPKSAMRRRESTVPSRRSPINLLTEDDEDDNYNDPIDNEMNRHSVRIVGNTKLNPRPNLLGDRDELHDIHDDDDDDENTDMVDTF
ncbi:unnamed protein product [Notodromas monacha]|uniref:Uncharacterized protein n=1 Tax=Notodromas monacha TaxID=399045 RepID=A0A7R9BXT1_9CRUS|nr:unnamed protein product [Notodromas monacha]CAG0923702.1 unnamed protein product [Notodromas monacha]